MELLNAGFTLPSYKFTTKPVGSYLALMQVNRQMCMIFIHFLVVSLLVRQVSGTEWTKAGNELRMPLELRVVNEELTHDENFWYMSNQHFLYRVTVYPVMKIDLANHDAIPDELKDLKYNHIGDIDLVDGIIYGGMENGGSEHGIIGAWNASDLTLIRYTVTEQSGMPWVAADPTTRTLYANDWGQTNAFQIYDMDTFALVGRLESPENQPFPKEVQGGAFYAADPGFLYLSVNTNCSVYKINLSTAETEFVLSDDYTVRKHEYEMEGLTFWDLRNYSTKDARNTGSIKGSSDSDRTIDLGVMHMFGNFMTVKEKSIHSYNPVE